MSRIWAGKKYLSKMCTRKKRANRKWRAIGTAFAWYCKYHAKQGIGGGANWWRSTPPLARDSRRAPVKKKSPVAPPDATGYPFSRFPLARAAPAWPRYALSLPRRCVCLSICPVALKSQAEGLPGQFRGIQRDGKGWDRMGGDGAGRDRTGPDGMGQGGGGTGWGGKERSKKKALLQEFEARLPLRKNEDLSVSHPCHRTMPAPTWRA